MKIARKKSYSGVFRDGGAGPNAKKRFRLRRQKLMKQENKLMVLTGVPYGPGAETLWTYAHCPTYQEPTIMHLTGVNQAKVLLLLDPGAKGADEILFVEKKNPKMEFWDGLRFGVGDPKSLAEVKKVTGFREVRDIAEFDLVFKERLSKQKKKEVGTFWLEGGAGKNKKKVTTDHNWAFKKRIDKLVRNAWGKGFPVSNIMKSHFDLRLPLDKYDVSNTLKAQKITGLAFRETLKEFRKFKNECQIQGHLEGRMLFRSAFGLSFPSIIASGPNATVLHYMKNDDDFTPDEMVLMDFGVRWMTMHADISRTVPASGKFNPMQKLLYEIVLGAQIAVQKKARAGVTIEELNTVCWETLNRELDEQFHARGGESNLEYKSRPHGVSHLIGEQEHDGDPFRDYTKQPMKTGWMISNEPGLYGKFRIKIGRKTYKEQLGIRLEDNLLITDKGCRNLSVSVPKQVSEIEALMRG
ncbi:MAG: M24 family metallopeptidase [Candidatus Nitronauta litoralis]|uniref:Xaa-Pro aminopeptidase n=1 Tax=Candidatus Nitronauta litoralis TaxID=2705533 RepID=A0A7T0BXA7_9BACT|nr:MAG: M24 family metallopeptidase [Candidatus Nitronauta litoralis]